jgi:drug/metabolite transporter (DMT)-like permease
MPTDILILVLLAALLHASWNALIKSSPDKFLDIVLVTSCAGLFSAVALLVIEPPAAASIAFIAASVMIHVGYFTLVGVAYRSNDMGNTYPIMRGAPPLIVALASGPLLGQALSLPEWLGIFLISGGILSLLLAVQGKAATWPAFLNALVIAAYTLVDGTGVRLSGAPEAYTMWMYLLTAPLIFGLALRLKPGGIVPHFRARWHLGLAGGACTLAAYCLVLFAMTRAPVAMVAAVRESAIIFGALIATLLLKERLALSRVVAAAIILLGILAIKLA